MPIDASTEELIPIATAAQLFPGKPVCIQTMHRWRLKGVRGVKLETLLIGGLRYTSKQAIERFIIAQNQASPSLTVAPQQRARQAKAALEKLAQMGIGKMTGDEQCQ